MKLYRYMSFDEFDKLTAGLDIVGKAYFKARTASTGVCFLPDNAAGLKPEFYLSFLSGIVTDDVMVEFDCQTDVTESWGIYANPDTDGDECIDVTEYCVPKYNRDTMVPLRYYIPGKWGGDGTWYTCN